MKKTNARNRLLLWMLATCVAAIFGATAAACVEKPQEPPLESPAIGVYYNDDNGTDYLLSLNSDRTVTLALGDSVPLAGRYEITDDGLITFSNMSDLLNGTATYANDAVTITYDGSSIKFLRNVEYTVTFDGNGGSATASQTVRNGKKAVKPADPAYSGHAFIGWYTDAAAKTPYKFDTAVVTSDLTLYAGWVEKSDRDEFTVKFNLGYGENPDYATAQTVNGKVYEAIDDPAREGFAFGGWWVKIGNDYAFRVDLKTYEFKQNETLYAMWNAGAEGNKLDAPIVNIDAAGNRIYWDAVDGAGSYSVKITDPEGNVTERPESGTSVDYVFDKAGTYTVEVYAVSLVSPDRNSDVTRRVYVHSQLARVSNFSVVGDKLTFGAVENAEQYLIYVACGEELHGHNPVDNGNSREFDFGDCAMLPDGIKFRVEARAAGFVSSVSEQYVVLRTLAKPVDFAYDEATQTVSWGAVSGAEKYTVTVVCSDGGHRATYEIRNGTSVSVRECAAGGITVSVVAKGSRKYCPSEQADFTLNKAESAAPSGLELNGTLLIWNAVEGAAYKVEINGKSVDAAASSLDLADVQGITWTQGENYKIKVRAVVGASLSSWSEELTARYRAMTEPTYSDGFVRWNPVLGASGYKVSVNGGEPVTVDGECRLAVTLTAKTNEIKVYLDGESAAQAKSVTVNAYAITFDGNGAEEAPATVYVANGDTLALEEGLSLTGYDFAGWFDAATGNGLRFESGDSFVFETDLTLYARWVGKEYTITLNFNRTGDDTDEVKSVTVKFGEEYALEVPSVPKAPIYGFVGWNTERDGKGLPLTDSHGNCTNVWDIEVGANGYTIYAVWETIFLFEKSESGGTHYIISKGSDTAMAMVTEIEIPAEYQAEDDEVPYPVTVVGGKAFSSSKTLTKITIPASIETIEATAFNSCSGLVNVVIKGGRPGIDRYWDVDGVLYGINKLTNLSEIVYYPLGRTGDYTIADGIDAIAYEGLKDAKINVLTIPCSVYSISGNAFRSSKITSIIFSEPEDATQPVKPLTINQDAFQSMSNLVSVTFPSRSMKFIDGEGTELTAPEFKASVFYGCSNLENVFVTDDNADGYLSVDGMLCKRDDNGADVTLLFCPNNHQFENGYYETNGRVSVIGKGAFSNCRNLRRITIGSSISRINEHAFSGYDVEVGAASVRISSCSTLISVTIVDRAAELYIGDYAFGSATNDNKYYCNGLNSFNYTSDSRIAVIGKYAFAYTNIGDELLLPASLTSVGDGAFMNCKNVTKVVFESPEDETRTLSFGSEVFRNCEGLTYIELPAHLTTFEGGVFRGCKNLATVDVAEGNTALESIDGVLYGKENGEITSIHFYPAGKTGEYVLPDGIKKLSAGVFENAKDSLKEIVINKHVTEIGDGAFKGINVTKVTFLNKDENDANDDGADVLDMGADVFYGCEMLAEVTLPARLTSIPAGTFAYTSSLKSIELHDNITSIGKSAFDHSGITSIRIPGTVETVGYAAFYNCPSLTSVYFEDGSKPLYFLDTNDEHDNYLEGDGATFAGSLSTFASSAALREVRLPERLVNIGKNTFASCTALTTINIPASVRIIGNEAFYNCKLLKTLNFADRKADGTEVLVLQDGGATSGAGAPSYSGVFRASGLEEIRLPVGLDRISNYAFYDCASLHTVHIPNTVHNTVEGSKGVAPVLAIGSNAFQKCYSLTNLDWAADNPEDLKEGGRVVSIGSYAINNTALTVVNLPARFGDYTNNLGNKVEGLNASIVSNKVQKIFIAPGGINYSSDASGIVYNAAGDEIVFCPRGYEGKVTVGANVTKIRANSFTACVGVSEVEFAEPAAGAEALPLTLGDETSVEGPFKETTFVSIELPERLTVFNKRAFAKNESLKFVSFKGTPKFTAIGEGAFYGCINLVGTNVSSDPANPSYAFVVPASVKTIADNVFSNTSSLKSIIFEGMEFGEDGAVTADTAALTELGASVFEKSGITSIYLPKKVTTLGDSIFINCQYLVSAYIPDTINNLNDAFTGCTKLQTLKLYEVDGADSNFTSENSIIFKTTATGKILTYYPMSLTKKVLTAEDLAGVTEIAAGAFTSNKFLTKIIIPNTVKTIGAGAFAHCISLKEVIFEDDTDATAQNKLTFANGTSTKTAFWGCYNLERVVFPQRLNSIGNYNLAYLPKLAAVTIPEECMITVLSQYAFAESGLKSPTGLTVDIPAKLIEFASYVFDGSALVGDIVIPATVTKFGSYVFRNSDITSVTFNTPAVRRANMTTGSNTFAGCKNLNSIVFPGDLVTVGGSACYQCESLTSISLPVTVTKIDSNAFKDCVNLKYINSEVEGTANLATTLTGEKLAINTINGSAFMSCESITAMTLPESLTSLGAQSLTGLRITEITIPNKVASAAVWFHNAKYDTTRIETETLTTVIFAEGNNSMSRLTANMFKNMTNLKTVVLPHDSTKFATITQNAFNGSGITSIEIPKTVTIIQYNAFENCASLGTVTFEKDDGGDCALQWIGNYAFRNSGLTSIEIPKSAALMSTATKYSTNVFENCASLTEAVFEKDSVIQNFVNTETAYSKHFLNCTSLTAVRLPENLVMTGTDLFRGCTSLENVIIPSTVKTLGGYVFADCTSLKSVKFGDVNNYLPETFGDYETDEANASLQTVNSYAFNGAGAAEGFTVNFPSTLATVSANAFLKSNLTEVTFGNGTAKPSLNTIGANAFEETKLQSLAIPASVTSIGASAFYKSTLREVTFAEKDETSQLTSIGNYAFRQTQLESVVIPASVTSIGTNPFAYCRSLASVDVEEANAGFVATEGKDAVYNKDMTVLYIYATGKKAPEGGELEVILPDTVTEVRPWAFFGGHITKLTIEGDGVVIGTYAFQANALTEITLGANANVGTYAFRYNQSLVTVNFTENGAGERGTSLGDYAFDYCTALESVTLPVGTKLGNNVFNECSEDLNVSFSDGTKPVVDSGVLYVEDNASHKVAVSAYKSNTSITSVVIKEGITEIGDQAFTDCTNLTSVVLPSTLKKIGFWAFRGCTSLETVNFPEGLEYINYYAFHSCPLTDIAVELPSITYMGSYTFYKTGIRSVKFGPNLTSLKAGHEFDGCANLTEVIFDKDGKDVDFGTSSTGNLFKDCVNMSKVVLPDAQTKLSQPSLFAGTNIPSITIPAGVTSISASAFSGCENLTEVIFAKNADGSCALTKIGASAFKGSGLTSISIPATVAGAEGVGKNAFENCVSLASVTFEKFSDGTCGITSIAASAFKNTGLTSIEIPKSVTRINGNAFENCANLTTVEFEGLEDGDYALTALDKLCFGNTGLVEFTVPANVKTTTNPFSGGKLKKLTLSANSASVPDLSACTALEELIIPEGVTTIGISYLANLTTLKKLVVPSTVEEIRKNAFAGWTAEQEIYFDGISAPLTGWNCYWRGDCEAKIVWDGVAEEEGSSGEGEEIPAPAQTLPTVPAAKKEN